MFGVTGSSKTDVLLGLLALAVVIGLMITIIAIFGGGLEATRG